MTRSPGELLARGTRSTVHAYGDGAVVKVPVASTPEGWIRYEADYAEAARAAGAPAPRLLGLERIEGRVASVWEHVAGISMWEQVVDSPDRGPALGRLLADIQVDLFDLVPPVTLPRQRDRLISKIRRTSAAVDASFARALEIMPPEVRPLRLCHGDLHPSNVILADGGPVLVDWFDASRGDPIADIARSSLTLLGDGAKPPDHLPGADQSTLQALTIAYMGRLHERLEVDDGLLGRWQAVSAVGRIAEGVASGPLVEVWARFAETGEAQAAAT